MVREMSGKLSFFQGQGIVRKFYVEYLLKCQGNVREFYTCNFQFVSNNEKQKIAWVVF